MRLSKEPFRALVHEIKRRASIVEIAEEAGVVLRHEGSCQKGLCPMHKDSATPSLAIYEDKGRWHCYGACQTGGDVFELYKRLHGVDFKAAVHALARRYGVAINEGRPPPPPHRDDPCRGEAFQALRQHWPYDRADAVYVYPLRGGGEAHEVRYRQGKQKRSVLCRLTEHGLVYGLADGEYVLSRGCWRRANKKTPPGGERRRFDGVRVGLYRPEVRARASKEDWVFLVEGPKDAETAIGLGLVATTCVNGAAGLKPHQVAELRGLRVAVVGDHDEAGQKGARRRAAMLKGTAREVRVVPPLGGKPGSGYDLADYVADQRRRGLADEAIRAALGEKVETARAPSGQDADDPDLVEIEVTTRENQVNDAALEALASVETAIFQRFGSLVHVLRADDARRTKEAILRPLGMPVIREVPEGKLREMLARRCRFMKYRPVGGELRLVPVHPPQWTTRALLARGEWNGLDHLEAVVESPMMRTDGSVLQESGFDRRSGLYYIPSTRYEPVPDKPSARQLEAALVMLREVVCDFPFQAEEHFSAWLSALLTPMARFAFKGPSPLNLIDANTRGAGKSLLVDVCNMIVTGRPAARMSYNRRDESELRKAVTSLALNGDQIVLIDNVRGAFGDPTLDRALTATTWKDRLLGSNNAVELPLDVTWYATGNNITLAADTPRRCLHIRLESPEENPEKRTEFRHPNLLQWIGEHRGHILPAALSLLRAWWVAGCPRQCLPGMGSYEGWSDTVRQCLVWLGYPDPAETRIHLEETADVEGAAVGALVLGLEELLEAPHLAGKATVGEILSLLESSSEDRGRLREAFAELVPRLRGGELPSSRQLGMLLRRHRGKYVGGACLTVRERGRNGAVWSVVRRKSPQKCDDGDDGDDARP